MTGDQFQEIADAIVDAATPDLVSTWPPGTLARMTKAVCNIIDQRVLELQRDLSDTTAECELRAETIARLEQQARESETEERETSEVLISTRLLAAEKLAEFRERNENLEQRLAESTRENERLTLRDELDAQLRAQIKAYYGKDGGLAALQDGHHALADKLQASQAALNLLWEHWKWLSGLMQRTFTSLHTEVATALTPKPVAKMGLSGHVVVMKTQPPKPAAGGEDKNRYNCPHGVRTWFPCTECEAAGGEGA